MINIGIIGYGYWGPNLTRSFNMVPGCKVHTICDLNPKALYRAKQDYPSVVLTQKVSDVFNSVDIDVVAIATPVSTHFVLSRMALKSSKHIFVEKPFTSSLKDAQTLVDLAYQKKLKIMVDHTFLFTGAMDYIKKSVDNDSLGKLYYYDSERVSLGAFQKDVNVIWDLAPHDLSIIDHIIKQKPVAITAQGMDHFRSGKVNIAYLTIYFADHFIAHIHVNWLAPLKLRKIMLSGAKKMLVWNDLEADEKIKIYDKGVTVKNVKSIHKLLIDYRTGATSSPRIDRSEALMKEAKYFIDCIKKDKDSFNDGHSGLRVVALLEAANKSLNNKGKLVRL